MRASTARLRFAASQASQAGWSGNSPFLAAISRGLGRRLSLHRRRRRRRAADNGDGDAHVVAALFMIPVVTLVLKRPLRLRRRGWVPLLMMGAERHCPPEPCRGRRRANGAARPRRPPRYDGARSSRCSSAPSVTGQVAFSRLAHARRPRCPPRPRHLRRLAEFRHGWRRGQGIVVMMTGGLVFALNGIFVSYQADGVDEYVLATWTVTFGAIFLTAAAFLFEDPLATTRGWDAIWPLVAEGVVGIGLRLFRLLHAGRARAPISPRSTRSSCRPWRDRRGATPATMTVSHVAGLGHRSRRPRIRASRRGAGYPHNRRRHDASVASGSIGARHRPKREDGQPLIRLAPSPAHAPRHHHPSPKGRGPNRRVRRRRSWR